MLRELLRLREREPLGRRAVLVELSFSSGAAVDELAHLGRVAIGIGFLSRVSTAHIAATRVACGATCRPTVVAVTCAS